MLSNIEVHNFQSLHHVDLELAPFTVIVGPTSSGKSALSRAIRTLTSNQRGISFLTHGARLCTISGTFDAGRVTLKRGKATDDNEYVLLPNNPNVPQQTHTKLGGETPAEVSAFIGIEAKNPINYAGQFDAPYLLSDSGGEVARVLGALTNVSVIFDGARESNRRKLANSSTMKLRASDLSAIMTKAESYKGIKTQREHLALAEESLIEARLLTNRLATLDRLSEQVAMAEQIIARNALITDAPLPSPDGIRAAAAQLSSLNTVLSTLATHSKAHRTAKALTAELAEQEEQLTESYTEKLISAGTCPTCHQNTSELEHTHA